MIITEFSLTFISKKCVSLIVLSSKNKSEIHAFFFAANYFLSKMKCCRIFQDHLNIFVKCVKNKKFLKYQKGENFKDKFKFWIQKFLFSVHYMIHYMIN